MQRKCLTFCVKGARIYYRGFLTIPKWLSHISHLKRSTTMAQKDATSVTEFDPSLPPSNLIGLEYFIPGIKESSQKRSFFCMLVNAYVGELENGERKTVATKKFELAFKKLLSDEITVCSGCGKPLSLEEFLASPLELICSDSESCKKSMIHKKLHARKEELIKELLDNIGRTKENVDTNKNHVSNNHIADNNQVLEPGLEKRRKDLEKLIPAYVAALQMNNQGTYGICIDCGEEIDEGRLLVAPNSTRCVHCKTAVEKSEKIHGKGGRMVARSHLDFRS